MKKSAPDKLYFQVRFINLDNDTVFHNSAIMFSRFNNPGDLFSVLQKAHGKCTGSSYEIVNSELSKVGWTFEKIERYGYFGCGMTPYLKRTVVKLYVGDGLDGDGQPKYKLLTLDRPEIQGIYTKRYADGRQRQNRRSRTNG